MKLTRNDWLDFSLLALFGVVLAQLFQVIYRYSYAPPATDVVFLLNIASVFILLLSTFVLSEKLSFPKVIGVAAGVLGMVSILANWERPSTFSPFSRYPREEAFILLAAFCWALFTVHARKILKRHNPLPAAFLTLGLGLIPLVFLAFVTDGAQVVLRISPSDWLVVLLLGVICTAVSYLLWFESLKGVEASEAGAVLLIAPVLLTSIIGIESKVGFFGTNPMVVPPVVAGSILAIAGIYLSWTRWMRGSKRKTLEAQSAAPLRSLEGMLVLLAAVTVFLAIVAFFLPVRANHLQGVLISGALYEAQWQTNAYETVGGYLILLVGLGNLVVSLRHLRRAYGVTQMVRWTVFSALLLASARFVGSTVFFSWVPWIPVEIQHAIGTEYVRISETSVTNVPMLLSMGLAGVYIVLAISLAVAEYFSKRGLVKSQSLR